MDRSLESGVLATGALLAAFPCNIGFSSLIPRQGRPGICFLSRHFPLLILLKRPCLVGGAICGGDGPVRLLAQAQMDGWNRGGRRLSTSLVTGEKLYFRKKGISAAGEETTAGGGLFGGRVPTAGGRRVLVVGFHLGWQALEFLTSAWNTFSLLLFSPTTLFLCVS